MILAFKWPLEVSWKADVIKYDFREGPRSFGHHPLPRDNFGFRAPVGGDRGGNQRHTLLPLRLKPTGRRIHSQNHANFFTFMPADLGRDLD